MKKSLAALMWMLTIAVLVLTIVALANFLQKKKDARPFNEYDFPTTLEVTNMTDYNRADTLCLYLAHHVLELDTMDLSIVYIPEHVQPKDVELFAIVQQLPFGKNQFLILLQRDELSLSKLKIALSHEFVHVEQYLSGDLQIYPLYAVWKGEDIYFGEVPYDERPFEQDAFKRDGKFRKELNKALYE